MLAVSNTSPISNLASIGRLSLMRSQFSELWIPTAVLDELTLHPDPVARFDIETAIGDRWIKTAAVQSSALLDVFLSSLHRGEAEAIALATNLKADIVVIDEQEGRQIATQAGISETSTSPNLRSSRESELRTLSFKPGSSMARVRCTL